MVQFNVAQREILLKMVYYGPALSGKTTNLQAIHSMAPSRAAGRLMTLETRDDRTLFFDLLPVFVRVRSGYKVKIKLFTVPGQVIHDTTRRAVLQGADGVIFVADSQVSETEANKASFANLRQNMAANQVPDDLPLVLQFNKRDLPNVRTEEELRALESRRQTPLMRASAIEGVGVRETLEALLRLVWDDLDQRHRIGQLLSVEREDFLQQLFADWRPPRRLVGPRGPA